MKNNKIYIACFAYFLSAAPLLAQNIQLIYPVELQSAGLTATESFRMTYFANKQSTDSIRLVQVNPLTAETLNGAPFFVSIPGLINQIPAWGQYVQRSPNGDYVLWANLGNNRGYFGIASNSAGKVAYLELDGQHYMIYLLSDRYNVLVKIKKNLGENEMPTLCPPELSAPSDITFSEDCDVDNDCPAVVSVLVLLTPEATSWLGSNFGPLEGILYVTLGLHSVNFAFINSGIYRKSLRFSIEQYNFAYHPLKDYEIDLANFKNDPVANNRRITTRSDLMFLMTDSRYFPLLGAVIGQNDRYAGLVGMEYMFQPWKTFAHEIGHMLFLNHNRASNGGDFPYMGTDFCGFGWRYKSSADEARTSIMATINGSLDLLPGARQLLNYSNPNIIIDGGATGTPVDFNARYAMHTACSIDDKFFDYELKADITGPVFACEETVTFSSTLSPPGAGVPGTGPYSYIWRLSDSPYFSLDNPGVLLSNNSTVSFYSGNAPVPDFWLFLSVSSADGVVVNDVHHVHNPCDGRPPTSENPDLGAFSHWKLSPNPTQGSVVIHFTDNKAPDAVRYLLYDATGRLQAQSGKLITLTSDHLHLDFVESNLENGLYFLQLQSSDITSTHKFFIQR
jgi:hypothetical protein